MDVEHFEITHLSLLVGQWYMHVQSWAEHHPTFVIPVTPTQAGQLRKMGVKFDEGENNANQDT